jgi:hypothetical protein
MRQITPAVSNETGVYVHFTHIVDNDSDPQALTVIQDVAEERRLAGAEKTGKHGYREPLDPVHRHSLNVGGRSAPRRDQHLRLMSLIRNWSVTLSFASPDELRPEDDVGVVIG